MEIVTAVWGLVGTVVGALASIGTTWITARNAKSIETEMARNQRIESAREYQRKTAIELQEALYKHARNSALVLQEKRRRERSKAHGMDKESQSDSKQEDMRQSGLAVSVLRERISNEAIRDLVWRFQNRCAEFSVGMKVKPIQISKLSSIWTSTPLSESWAPFTEAFLRSSRMHTTASGRWRAVLASTQSKKGCPWQPFGLVGAKPLSSKTPQSL